MVLAIKESPMRRHFVLAPAALLSAMLFASAAPPPANAGMLTYLAGAVAFGACKSNPTCAAKLANAKARMMGACANSAKCSNFAGKAAGYAGGANPASAAPAPYGQTYAQPARSAQNGAAARSVDSYLGIGAGR
jgi:hypothetical protein